VAKGVKVAHVDIGGLSATDARAKLERELAAPLRKPLTIPIGRAKQRDYHLTARGARLRVDVAKTVDEAVKESREGGVFARTWRGITGGERKVTIKPKTGSSNASRTG
jgi:hypothetical protein